MSRGLNKIMLIGNVGAEPEVRQTQGGQQLANFSIATSRAWTDGSGQKQERTEWHRCTAWGKLAEVVEKWVHKGDRLYVDGRVEYNQTEDGGATKHWTNITVNELVMLGGAPSTGAPTEPGGGYGRGGL